ncbi:MAG: PqqD family peptide modification chaperone [Deltaproteobacteria bacterium]|nr:PqqD family peptide modification chaperone [Deltaproteobacteria bacterium]
MEASAQLLGRYRLLSRLGIGGMAEVFRSEVVGAGDFSRTVVVKRMLPQLAADHDAVMMFLDEARLGAKLHHPNIVSVLDLGERDGDYFMVMEYVDGVDLGTIDARLRSHGLRFPQDHAAWIIARAAEGLGAAHDARDPATDRPLNIVHRDVSPSNILVSRTADVKVADFGVARSSAQHVRTGTGVLKGKVPYMAPEHLLGEEVDARSDVYGLGVVLWQLLAGRKRHEGRNDLKIIQSVVQERPPPPSQFRDDIDPQLDEIAMAMLERRPQDRPASAWALAQQLDDWLVAKHHTGRPAVERWLRATLDGALASPMYSPLGPPHGAIVSPAEGVPRVVDGAPRSLAGALPSDRASVTERSPYLAAGVPDAPTVATPTHVPTSATMPERSRWQEFAGARVRPAPGVQARVIDGQTAIIVAERRQLHSLNTTAAFIWERADGSRTLAQLAEEMLPHFEVELATAQDEVLSFVLAAIQNGMLVVEMTGARAI